MAVPFIAADQPNERSEFQHPDKALTVTTLARYQTGLTRAQVAQTMRTLEELQPSSQKRLYWCAATASSLD